jgi:hypothetical protein
MSAPPRPIRTPAVLRAIRAPELDRYLSRRSVDLLVTDQIEALRVRVAKGMEVLERKTRAGIRAGRRRAVVLAATLAAGLLLAAAHAVLAARGGLRGEEPARLLLSLIATLALLAGLIAGARLVRVLGEVARLTRILGRHGRGIESADTPERLLDLAEKALEEAREIGAVPPPAQE